MSSINQKIIYLIINSSLLEIRTWPKPGNVHRTQNFPNTKYEDFLKAVFSLKDVWNWYYLECKKYFDCINFNKLAELYSSFVEKAVIRMMEVQSGGNVLLGHILLLGSLFIPAAYGILKRFSSISEFWSFYNNIIENSTPQDTIRIYKAIRIANPGGMGSIEKYDLYNENVFDEIIKDQINLKKIFKYSSERDSISECIATNFEFIRNEILPRLDILWENYENKIQKLISKLDSILINKDLIEINIHLNELIIRLFLYILMKKLDTLIIRKNDISIAKEISKRAENLYQMYFIMDKELWMQELYNFDNELQQYKGKRNPGATADLLAATIFLKIIFLNLKL